MVFPNPIDILRFLLGLSVLVFVHELGHFLAARRAGIKVEEFGIGFPPRILKKKIGETLYSLNLFPIGGFVRLYGEEENVEEDKERAFYHKSLLARAEVVVAGVVMNFLLAFLLFSAIFWNVGIPKDNGMSRVTILGINPESPASQAGIKSFDQILKIGDRTPTSVEEVQGLIRDNVGKNVELELRRVELFFLTDKVIEKGEPETLTLNVTPRTNPPEGQGALGVGLENIRIVETDNLPLHLRLVESVKNGFIETASLTKRTFEGLGQMITTLFVKKEAPKDVAGPVGIYQMTNEVAKLGVLPLIYFLAILSLNLGVLNIMPFPALDGGRLVFIVTEAIFGKKVHAKVEYITNMVGLGLLILFLLWVTRQDILRGGVSGL